MPSALWLPATFVLLLVAVAAFLLGRATGSRSAETARASERLEAERRLATEHAGLIQSAERVAYAERERDARFAELERAHAELGAARAAASAATAEGMGLRTRLQSVQESLGEQLRAAEARHQAAADAAVALQHSLGASERARTQAETELEAERAAAAERLEAAQQVAAERLEAAQQAAAERLEAARKADAERAELFRTARADMAHSFETLAATILEDKSKRFTDHNRTNLEQLLTPLREKLGEFQQQVDGLHKEGLVGRTELRTQIEALRGMNEKLSTDANNLVKALKGSSKQQGDWGEVLLIGMLEEAGLRQGQQYRVQSSFATEEGRQARPDIILDLPGEKHLVIDSKVSLTSYTEYCACDDESSRAAFLERHARSLRDHIDNLSRKNYQTLHQLRSLDFVVMFVPIEPAYLLALAYDGALWQRAWKKDVLLVSPGTLFPVIRTVAHIWQQERQTRNTEEIVRQASGLYDKLAGFAETFEEVGKRIDGARLSYDRAFSQLSSGKGHVLGRVARLKALGLQTTKTMPESFLSEDLAAEAADAAAHTPPALPPETQD